MKKKIKRRSKGFTLVELVITIAIDIILSVISVPIYRGYVNKAKMAEGYALLGALLSAQKAYYSEYGNFLRNLDSVGDTNYDPVLGVDARGNKYFTYFTQGAGESGDYPKYYTHLIVHNTDLWKDGHYGIRMWYYTTSGGTLALYPTNI